MFYCINYITRNRKQYISTAPTKSDVDLGN